MLLRIFKGYQAFLLIFIPMAGIGLWLNAFFVKEFELNGQYVFMPLSDVVFNILGYNSFISKFVALVLVLANALFLVRMNISYNFIRRRTYLPAIIYLLLMSHIQDIQRLTPALMASFFVILAMNKILYTFKKDKLAIHIMDASLLVSVASLFYFPALFLIVYLWVGLMILRPFLWREWAFTIIGMATPYLILASMYFIYGKEINISFRALFSIPFVYDWSIKSNILTLVFFIYSALLIILASFQMLKLFGTKKVHSRRFFIFFLWLFVITVALFIIVPGASIEIFYINGISLAFLFSHYFVNLRGGWVSELMFLIFVGIIILNKFI